MYSPQKRKRCVLRCLAGEVLAEVARQEKVDEKTLQRWVKADGPKDKPKDNADSENGLSKKSVDVASRGNASPEGVDPRIEAALGKAGAGSPTTVKPEEIAAQKALTLETDQAFCLSSIKTSKAASIVMVAPFLGIPPTHPKIQTMIELAPHTIEVVKANAGPLAAELRKVIGDSLYLVYMALLGEGVMTAFSMFLLFRELHPKKPKADKASEAHDGAHKREQEGPKA